MCVCPIGAVPQTNTIRWDFVAAVEASDFEQGPFRLISEVPAVVGRPSRRLDPSRSTARRRGVLHWNREEVTVVVREIVDLSVRCRSYRLSVVSPAKVGGKRFEPLPRSQFFIR